MCETYNPVHVCCTLAWQITQYARSSAPHAQQCRASPLPHSARCASHTQWCSTTPLSTCDRRPQRACTGLCSLPPHFLPGMHACHCCIMHSCPCIVCASRAASRDAAAVTSNNSASTEAAWYSKRHAHCSGYFAQRPHRFQLQMQLLQRLLATDATFDTGKWHIRALVRSWRRKGIHTLCIAGCELLGWGVPLTGLCHSPRDVWHCAIPSLPP